MRKKEISFLLGSGGESDVNFGILGSGWFGSCVIRRLLSLHHSAWRDNGFPLFAIHELSEA